MADVARLAGVSVSTVSYALSGTRPISLSTRERIEQAMLDLGYTPNAFARGLKSKRSRIIALLFPARAGSLRLNALECIVGASDHAQQRGYHLMLWTGVEAGDDLTQLAGQGLVDGALVMGVRLHDPRIQVLVDAGVPFAMIGHDADPGEIDFTDTDFEQSARLAVGHLVEQGHQRLGFLGDGENPRPEKALRRAASMAGADLVAVDAGASVDAGRGAFTRLLQADPNLTAIIAFNEHAVPGVMRAAGDLGRRIPQDLSIMCIDMPPHVAELTTPPMTTVEPSAAHVGRAAVDMLLRRLNGDTAPPRQLLFGGELNLRGSCAPAPSADDLHHGSTARQRRHQE
ncbi:LacI family DNA-binding transcriptional regulator [Kineosporia sp. J2-2]|uniref:LacI family DNA-binding transcriptional regulator n=1 Tax=Kineosporia corallincola TaxID=2835133 RepID=A0ABS5TSR9_9ACTN|nr:LacI family DNA-binding transcriptional regulator [Kineosporia corallincola]MBT0773849.1 LacI family DNA-binding transcriptional regulator [Kineosporia corallincola]